MEWSDYYKTLTVNNQKNYEAKVSIIPVDPYCIKFENCTTNVKQFPNIRYPDIVNYFLYEKSAYTMEQLRSYKSLEAYNQMVCGWVKKLAVKQYGTHTVVLGKVMHSQRLRDTLLSPWVLASQDGHVVSAHCDCVAGLSGTCSHVGAILFEIDKHMYALEETTVTGEKAYWMGPSTSKSVEPKRIAEIDLSVPEKRIHLDEEVALTSEKITVSSNIEMTKSEKEDFLRKLMSTTSRGSVSHLVTSPFAEDIKKQYVERKKFYITSHYKPEYEKKSLLELQEIGSTIDFTLSIEECKQIESETKNQAKSRQWHLYRGGRVTASKFKSCCRTNIENPSVSLIKTICSSPKKYKVAAMEYGCRHERQAVKDFLRKTMKDHSNLQYEKVGFFINPKYPYFGVSPDGIIKCDCCGMGLIEIKCPYYARRSGILEKIGKKSFFIKKQNNDYIVDENHAYYYQVQMQLAVTRAKYCYLVAWSKKDLVYVRVTLNESFWNEEKLKAEQLFFKVLLPEILGRYFTRGEGDEGRKVNWPELVISDSDEEEIDEDEDEQTAVCFIDTTGLDYYEEEVGLQN